MQAPLTDSLEEQLSFFRKQKASKSKSWSFPNKRVQPPMITDCPPMETSWKGEQITRRIKGFLALIFCLGLLLYLYIILEPSMSREDKTVPKGQVQDGDCFDQFRRNNCNLQHPEGETCLRLYSCIAPSTSSSKTANITNKNETNRTPNNTQTKIESLEELLENILLILGGGGVMNYLRQIISFPRLLDSLTSSAVEALRSWTAKVRSKLGSKKAG